MQGIVGRAWATLDHMAIMMQYRNIEDVKIERIEIIASVWIVTTPLVLFRVSVCACTVEPPNNGQVGTSTLVHYSEVVLYWGVLVKKALYLYCMYFIQGFKTYDHNQGQNNTLVYNYNSTISQWLHTVLAFSICGSIKSWNCIFCPYRISIIRGWVEMYFLALIIRGFKIA